MKYKELLFTVKEILFYDWDPIGINDEPLAVHEYDSYAPTICRYLYEGVDAQKIVDHLTKIQETGMGVFITNGEHHRKIASKLLSLLK